MIATKSATLLTQATTNQQRKRKALLTSTAMAAAGLLALTTQAHADNWTDHEILSGSTTVDTSVANTTNILQGTHFVKARGNGDINAGWTVNVAQPSTSAKYVLYDVKGDATQLLGTLNANGEIYIFNQQGIIFGADSVVNVGAIVASTGSISDEDILSGGKLVLENVDTGASIVLNGSVTVAEAGLAAFVAPTVVNNGVISAKLGKVALASGNKVTLDLYGDNLVEIAVDDKVASGLIENNGTISAEGGTVYMAAQTAKEAVDTVINMKGVVSASSASVQGGKIVLSGGKQGKVAVSGAVKANGATAGGDVSVTGQDIEVTPEASLSADATDQGNGGRVYLYADNNAVFRGRASAQGGVNGGNGGFVEVSAANEIGYDGSVSTWAAAGISGHFLLDPLYAVIHSGSLNNSNFISANSLANDLRNNANVTVQADNYIDVGTNTPATNVGTEDIDLSVGTTITQTLDHYEPTDASPGDKKYEGRYNACNSGTPGANCVGVYTTTTSTGYSTGNLVLDSNTVNFVKNLTMGRGSLTVDANTINLNSKIYGLAPVGNTVGLLGMDRIINSVASTVNVQSNKALINQAIHLAGASATVNVAAGTYNESVNVYKNGLGLYGTNAIISPNSPGFSVGANNVTIDGFTIDNADHGIEVTNANNVTLSNNWIKNLASGNGVQANNADNLVISGNTFDLGATNRGVNVFNGSHGLTVNANTFNGGQIGIHVLDSNNVTVGGFGAGQANNVTGSYVGIKIQNSDAATVAKNTINNSGWDAIQIVDGSDNAQVLNNDINGVTGASGIAVMNNSHGAVLDGNTIDDTARLGIYVWNSNGLNIKNNLINNAGLEGSGWYLSGIHLEGANNTTVDNNEVKNARGDGIHVGGAGNQAAQSTTGNVIKNNSVFLITGDAVDVADSAGVQITGNALGTDSLGGGLYLVIGANNVGGKGVNLNNSANASITNNVIFQVAGNGIAVAGSSGTTVSGNYVDAVGANAVHVLNSANARILNNNIGNVPYFGADNIKGDGIYVENSNGTWIKGNAVTETYSTAFDVGSGIHVKNSNNVVVGGAGADRNNLTNIAWDGVKITGGDKVSVDNNRIQNVTRVGIYGGNTTNATIKNNVLVNANTGLGGYGAISTDGGSGLKITGNDIDGSVGHGIRVNGATGTNLIDGNFVDGVSQDGINTEGVNKLTVSNNKVGQSSTVGATGINVVNGTHSTTISNNLVDRVGWTGIAADTVAGLKVLNNTVGANSASVGQGIYVNNSTNADVIGNNVYNAMQYGLYANLSNGLDVYDNDIGGLGSSIGAGVYIQNSSNVNIGDYDQYFLWWKTADRDNRIGSFQQGVYISGGAHNDVVNNEISNVHYGVTLSGTTNADVTDNTLTGNSVTGVSVGAGSDYATINNNSISHFETAISVDSSNFVNVDNNSIFNVDNGIYATNTYGLNIEDNDITGGHCGWGDGTGIHVDNSSNVRIGGLFDGNDVDSFYDGIRVSDSEDVRISFNDVWNMDHDGIQAFGGDDVNISWNHVTDVSNDGIFVGGMSDWNYDGESDELVPNAVISHNVVDWTGGDGIEVNDVTYSRISHNAVGLDGYASEDNYYEYDDGVSIGQNGIVVSTEYWDDPTEIDGNLVANTGWNGIAVYGVEEVTITNNTVWNTHDNGIVVEDAEWVDISGNYVGVARPLFGPFSIGGGFIGDDGIRVGNYWYGNYGSVWITDNHVGNTGDDGIDVYGVSEARILGNDVNMTGDDGIVASNIGDFFYGPSIFALEGDYEGDESEEGPYYSLIIADNTVTDAGQRNQNDDDCGDCESEEFVQIFEGDHENYGGDGIDVSGTSSALIEGNEVDNSYDDGIVVSGFGDRKMGKRGFSIYQDGPSEYGPSTSVVIRDNDVTNSGSDGIEVSNIDDATVDINRILNSGINGFHAGGLHNGTVVLTGNTFTDNPVGALFESGMIDLTGEANIFNGGGVGLRFDPKNEEVYVGDRWVPYEDYDYEEYSFYESGYWESIYENVTADLNLVDNTIGTTIFNGQSQYYVELLDGALFAPGTPTIINGLNATYDGFRPSTVGGILTQDQYNALEAKIYHYNDLASLGLFFFGLVPNEIDQEDIFRNILGFSPRNGSLNLTITGLPVIPGFAGSAGSFLNSIAPAAGGNDPQQLANLEPAAGGDNSQPQGDVPQADDSSCWGDAMEAASGGAIVNMNYDMSPDAALNQAAACQSGI